MCTENFIRVDVAAKLPKLPERSGSCRQTRRSLLEERQDRPALQLAADDHLANGINSVNLEDRLGDVEPIVVPVCLGSPSLGNLNSARIHGPHVTVEEPSTASIAEVNSLGACERRALSSADLDYA